MTQSGGARRSSTSSRAGCRAGRRGPAQSDERVRRRVEARRVGEALERAHEHGQLEVGLRDAVRRRLHAGARRAPAPTRRARRRRARRTRSGPRPGRPRARAGSGRAAPRARRARSRRGRRRGGAPPRGRRPCTARPRPCAQRSSRRQNASAATSQARSCAISRRARQLARPHGRRGRRPSPGLRPGVASSLRPRPRPAGSSAAGGCGRRRAGRRRRAGAPGAA